MNGNDENIYVETEREIRLKELLFFVLKGWRMIFLLLIILSLLLGFGKFIKDRKSFRTELTDAEKTEIMETVTIAKELGYIKEYYDSSILMQINPYVQQTVKMEYYIDTNMKSNYAGETELDYSTDLIKGYGNYITGGGLGRSLIEKLELDMETLYINELISFEQGAHIFNIEISSLNEEMSSKLESAIKESVEEYQRSLSGIMGEHGLTLLNSSFNVKINEDLLEKQSSTKESIEATAEKLDGLIKTMNTPKLNYYYDMLDDGEENLSVEYTEVKGPILQIKYFGLGGILGTFVSVCILFVLFIINNKLKSTEELKDNYGIKVLGSIVEQKNEKNFFIDRWIMKLQNNNKEYLSYGEQVELLVSNIYLICNRLNIGKVFLAGKNLDRNTNLVSDLTLGLKKRNITLSYGDNLVYNVTALENAAESDGIILLEEINQSTYKDVEQEIQICVDQKIRILGAVVVPDSTKNKVNKAYMKGR